MRPRPAHHAVAIVVAAIGGVLAGSAVAIPRLLAEEAKDSAKDVAPAGDWPGWRGPEGAGISRETGIREPWPEGGLPVLWRIDVGSGFSSFAAVGARLFTMDQVSDRQRVLCLDAETGRTLWSHDLEEGFGDWQGGDGPRATPAVKGDLVYALGARGTLAALSTLDGRPAWRLDVLEKFRAKNIQWGLSGSPVVEGGVLVVPVGAPNAPIVAFDLESGQVAWRSGSDGQGDRAGYSTPYAITHAGSRQILAFLGRSIVSLEPEGGKVLWRYYWRTDWDVNAAAPIYHDGHVFISSGYDRGSALLRVPAQKGGIPEKVWESRVLRNKFSSSVLHEGHLYGFDETRLKCVEMKTGEEKWKQSGFGYGSLLLVDGRLVILGDAGDLALARATPTRYVETARMARVIPGRSWTVPVLHRGILYLRNLKQAVALRIRSQ
jgi:outer membrane protein assembly factor BamB